MKEATGELNMTVVIVMAVGILSAFFFTVLWPNLQGQFIANSNCRKAVCDNKPDSNGMVTCKFYDEKGIQKGSDFKCIWKG